MAQKADATLQTDRAVIENETATGANTAVRVGNHFEDIIDSKINNDKIVDEDDMVSNSATKVPTQQSVKAYVDTASLGVVTSWKAPVRVATTVAGTLASSFENGDTVDGVVLATGNRILIKNQADQTENGIRVVAASGAPARSTDANEASELEGAAVSVLEGTSNANTTWTQTTDGVTIGVSNILWSQLGTSVADADATTKGIARLYPSTSLGTNTDGAPTQNAVKVYSDLKQLLINSATALTDASTIDLTAIKHTLSTSSATRTFTISYTGDDLTMEVTLSATSSVFTFPATSLCVSEGIATGDNTCPLAGVSGDKYLFAIKKIGSNYRVVCKNFGQ